MKQRGGRNGNEGEKRGTRDEEEKESRNRADKTDGPRTCEIKEKKIKRKYVNKKWKEKTISILLTDLILFVFRAAATFLA